MLSIYLIWNDQFHWRQGDAELSTRYIFLVSQCRIIKWDMYSQKVNACNSDLIFLPISWLPQNSHPYLSPTNSLWNSSAALFSSIFYKRFPQRFELFSTLVSYFAPNTTEWLHFKGQLLKLKKPLQRTITSIKRNLYGTGFCIRYSEMSR